MKSIVLIIALLPGCATAEPWAAGVHTLSFHDRAGFNTLTPGLYVKAPNGLTAGVLRNSVSTNSAYVAWTLETIDTRFGLTVGVITGYPGRPAFPMLLPSARISLWRDVSLRTSFIPRPPGKGGASALHLSLETQF